MSCAQAQSWIFLAVTGLLFQLLVSCSSGSDNTQTKELVIDDQNRSTQSSTAVADSAFLLDAYSYGVMLVQYSELAMLQSQRKDVTSFAEQSASWHKSLNQEIKKVADQQELTLPEVAGDNVHQYMSELRELPADRFDTRYLQVLQEIQGKMIKAYEQQSVALADTAAIENSANPGLQRLISEKLPDLHAHAQAVKELASQVKN